MTTNKPEQLARRVRAAAGPYNNQDMPVQQVVSAMAARIAELEAALAPFAHAADRFMPRNRKLADARPHAAQRRVVPMKPIPISAAERIAKEFGYDQVIIVARKVGDDPDPHGEHVTTYGVTKAHCSVAARIGDFLKHRVMGWVQDGDK